MAINKSQKLKIKNKKEVLEKEIKNIAEKNNQIFRGRVVAAKTLHTATVLLERRKTHPLYKKSYAQSKRFLVQDDLGVKNGDLVEIVKCRPISKNKHFKIVKVVGVLLYTVEFVTLTTPFTHKEQF